MRHKPSIETTVDRCRALWRGEALDPPFVMLGCPEASMSSGAHDCDLWQDPDAFTAKYAAVYKARRNLPDDTVPIIRPPFSHSPLPFALGAEPELLHHKLWVRPILKDIREHEKLTFREDSAGLDVLRRYYARVLELTAGRFAVGMMEVPGPADLMGALLGFEEMLYALHDDPDLVREFASHAAQLCRQFHEWVRQQVDSQESFGGVWMADTWAPTNSFYFCEHSSVNYSPQSYEDLIVPANTEMLEGCNQALSYLYCTAGKHHLPFYLHRGCTSWSRTCDNDPPAEAIRARTPGTIITIHVTVEAYADAVAQYGTQGICYSVTCASLEDAMAFRP